MYNQSAQPFCTNCGQYLPVGATQCPRCVVAVGTSPAGGYGQPAAYPPPYAPYPPPPAVNAPLMAAGAGASAQQRRARRSGSKLRGCAIVLLILAVLAAPFVGIAFTHGQLQMIFIYAAVGVGGLVVLVLLIAVLSTRRGREAAGEVVAEGCAEGCLELLTGGLFGG